MGSGGAAGHASSSSREGAALAQGAIGWMDYVAAPRGASGTVVLAAAGGAAQVARGLAALGAALGHVAVAAPAGGAGLRELARACGAARWAGDLEGGVVPGGAAAVSVWSYEALLGELMVDPRLPRFHAVVLDAFERRAAACDLALCLLRKVRRARDAVGSACSPLRLVVVCRSEASADFALRWLDDGAGAGAVVVDLRGSAGEAGAACIHFRKAPCRSFVHEAVQVIARAPRASGLVVCLLPCERSAAHVHAQLEHKCGAESLALYAWPDSAAAERAPPAAAAGQRAVLLVSLSSEELRTAGGLAALPPVALVVDTMHVRRQWFDAAGGGLDVSGVLPVTREEAAWRAALFPGAAVLRMCPEAALAAQPLSLAPEVQRCDLAPLLLRLAALAVGDVLRFELPSAMPSAGVVAALDSLHALGAVDNAGRLTPDGARLCELLPLEPALGKLLLHSLDFGCAQEALSAAAAVLATHEGPLFALSGGGAEGGEAERRRLRAAADDCVAAFGAKEGDLVFYANLMAAHAKVPRARRRAWCEHHALRPNAMARAAALRAALEARLARIAARQGLELLSCCEDAEALQRCACAAFFISAARLAGQAGDGRAYRTLRSGLRAALHPSSLFAHLGAAPPAWVVVPRLAQGELRHVTPVRPDWLIELAPHVYSKGAPGAAPAPAAPSLRDVMSPPAKRARSSAHFLKGLGLQL
jgi:ATP-dependent RNA helicase DDX35